MHAFVLCHPQSRDLVNKNVFDSIKCSRISCGTSYVPGVDLSESNDFFPTYASWNSALFETSVILTIWEHIEQLSASDNVAIMHSDVIPHFSAKEIWEKVNGWLSESPKRAVGLTAPAAFTHSWDDWLIPENVPFIPKCDPMQLHSFESSINVWDFIKTYDFDIYSWAMDTQPRLIYSHQFACSREAFNNLGSKLYNIVHRMRLQDVGFWTPHVFERLIALYLAKFGGSPILSTAFWHVSSSSVFGPGQFSLYGPRPRRYYKMRTKWNLK